MTAFVICVGSSLLSKTVDVTITYLDVDKLYHTWAKLLVFGMNLLISSFGSHLYCMWVSHFDLERSIAPSLSVWYLLHLSPVHVNGLLIISSSSL